METNSSIYITYLVTILPVVLVVAVALHLLVSQLPGSRR